MILTYKIKHNSDFSAELKKAKKVAKFAIANRDRLSSKYVAHIGLKSAISNAILYKYGRNKTCEEIKSVKLSIPNQHLKHLVGSIHIPCLKLTFPFDKPCEKVNQVEIDNEYLYVSVTVPEEPQYEVRGWLGIDRNTTGHCAVAACTATNQVLFLGKRCQHIHKKYQRIRKHLQVLGKTKKLVAINRRESDIQKDINHKLSRKLVDTAKASQCGIKMEELQGIRERAKQAKSFKYSLNSWAYYQLQTFTEYKAKLAGVPIVYIAPQYTSQGCHKCGLLGNRNGKAFKCPHCGYTSHADSNAAWNIATSTNYIVDEDSKGNRNIRGTWKGEKLLVEPHPEHCTVSGLPSLPLAMDGIYSQRFAQDEDCAKGNPDIPQGAML